MNESGKTLAEIEEAVVKVSSMIADISSGAEEQTSIEQVNTAVAQMDEMTQQNAALVEEAPPHEAYQIARLVLLRWWTSLTPVKAPAHIRLLRRQASILAPHLSDLAKQRLATMMIGRNSRRAVTLSYPSQCSPYLTVLLGSGVP